jgi:hypothetical protein
LYDLRRIRITRILLWAIVLAGIGTGAIAVHTDALAMDKWAKRRRDDQKRDCSQD